MAYLDNDKINEIRNSVNIVDIIGSYLPLVSKGKGHFCVCPFHDDHSPSMSISSEKQIYKCFSCRASGNVFTFVKDYENVPFLEAVSLVAKKAGIDFSFAAGKKSKEYQNDDLKILDTASKYYQNNIHSSYGITAMEYLNKRGITEEIISEFKIGLALSENNNLTDLLLKKNYKLIDLQEIGLSTDNNTNPYDIFVNRIIFPIWDKEGNVVAFSGRIYDSVSNAKYVNSRSSRVFRKSEILYNYHEAKVEAKRLKKIIVVEGFLDVIRFWSIGVKNAVALMGTAFTLEQLDLLKQLRCEIVLCFDNDVAGGDATIVAGDMLLKNKVDFSVIRIHKYKDPDEFILNLGKEEMEKVISSGINFMDFKINYLKKKYNVNDSLELSKLINELLPSLDNLNDPVYKELVANRIAKEFEIDVKLLNFKSNNIAPLKKEKEANIITPKRKTNKYNKAAEEFIYLMMCNYKYIKIFEKRLGFFPEPEYRSIVNEIRCFYETNKYIDVADFMTYVEEKENIQVVLKEIIVNGYEDIEDSELELIIDIINNKLYSARIQKLKFELEKAENMSEKIEITKKIVELKKGSVENG